MIQIISDDARRHVPPRRHAVAPGDVPADAAEAVASLADVVAVVDVPVDAVAVAADSSEAAACSYSAQDDSS